MKFISECSLSDVILKLQTAKLTPENLIDELCNKLDNWDLKIKAFLPEKNRRKRLHNDLQKLYKKFPDSQHRPLLFGIPIGVKDIFHVNGFITKAGSEIPHEILQGKESVAVTKLKDAGAVILGKTVTTEFAYFHPGPTSNPHNFAHTPGGSSSGSAAAVAAGFCPLALGTQTIGSISRPASFCGTFGYKPSFGRISTSGVVPFSISADHIGFFTQDISGSELVASLLCDEWDSELPKLNKKPVFGIPEGKYLHQASKEILSAFWNEVEKLKQRDFIVKSIPAFTDIKEINKNHKLMNAAEFTEVHKSWFKKYKNLYKPASIKLIEKGKTVSNIDLRKSISGRIKVRKELEFLQRENEIDIWLSPSTVTTAPRGLNSTGDPAMNLPWTYAGVPTISVPFGFINKLPFDLQFAGQYYKDEILFKMLRGV